MDELSDISNDLKNDILSMNDDDLEKISKELQDVIDKYKESSDNNG